MRMRSEARRRRHMQVLTETEATTLETALHALTSIGRRSCDASETSDAFAYGVLSEAADHAEKMVLNVLVTAQSMLHCDEARTAVERWTASVA
jgi:hypothetical protein